MTVAKSAKSEPAPRSEAQRQQARINGAKSRGPKTEAGKAVSCQNAVQHGFRSETVVSADDIQQYETVRDSITNDLDRPIRTIDRILAGNIASAVIRVEKLSTARITAVATNKQNIRTRHRRRRDRSLENAAHAMSQGRLIDGFALYRRSVAGCDLIASHWEQLRERLQILPPDSPITPELWSEIHTLVLTLETRFRLQFGRSYEHAEKHATLSPARLIEHCQTFINIFRDQARTIARQRRRSLRHRLTIADADLGKDGQLRERYLTMARSAISRHAQQMDMETHRQWRRNRDGQPAPNEPEDSPQTVDESSVVEFITERPEPIESPIAEPTPKIESSAPNEPEDSPQTVDKFPVVEISNVRPEPTATAIQPSTPATPRPIANPNATRSAHHPNRPESPTRTRNSLVNPGPTPPFKSIPPTNPSAADRSRACTLAPNEPEKSTEPSENSRVSSTTNPEHRRG